MNLREYLGGWRIRIYSNQPLLQRVAEKHIKQFSPCLPRKQQQGEAEAELETMSMPGTPLGARRPGQAAYRGGSLERQTRAGDKVGHWSAL